MDKFITDTINKQYPPAYVNNSREIITRKIKSFQRSPSSAKAQEIENLTGMVADYTDADNGTHPKDLE